METSTVGVAAAGAVVGSVLTAVGNIVLKLFLSYSGYKKERDRTTHDELRKIIDGLHEDLEQQQIDFNADRGRQDARYSMLENKYEQVRADNLFLRERIARMEVLIESLIDKIKTHEPAFTLKLTGTDSHSPLPNPERTG